MLRNSSAAYGILICILIDDFFLLGVPIFEGVQYQNKLDFVRAIIKCSIDDHRFSLDKIPPCSTLQQTCSIIKSNNSLNELNNVLCASIKSYHSCHSCNAKPESRFTLAKQIFVFKINTNNDVVGFPITTLIDNQTYLQEHCSSCNSSNRSVQLPIYKQILMECPIFLIVRFSMALIIGF